MSPADQQAGDLMLVFYRDHLLLSPSSLGGTRMQLPSGLIHPVVPSSAPNEQIRTEATNDGAQILVSALINLI
jgi:hypothetical protein